nr:PREDICTED: leucine-rich repeat-containing G-protein coupled receptor 5-like [Lepisosteus oculatus]
MRAFYIWFLFHLWFGSSTFVPQCEKGCDCQEVLKCVNCSKAAFTYIPGNLSSDTEHFDLSWNNLTVIPVGALSFLWRLKVLLINDNDIRVIEDGAFSCLENLRRLDLSRNKISSLGNGFSIGLQSLGELLLSENQLRALNSESFQHLDNLQKLNLSCNNISYIEIRAFRHMTYLRQLHLNENRLATLNNNIFSMLKSLEVLNLEGNQINNTDLDVFMPLSSLTLLNLVQNQLQSIKFKTFVSIHNYETHILLAGNHWHCDCDLQRVFRKLQNTQRLILDDYEYLTCKEPHELEGHKIVDVENELCFGETVTVLIITFTVIVTVVAAIVMAERNRKKRTGKHWSEESDMTYDSQD